jgi:DNA repair protein RAD5
VFSQFTSFLDTFEQVIEVVMPGVEIMKFYGSMNHQERDDVVFRFNNSREPRIILVSLMAGGVGLSLHHGSSTVFLSEPYYNPFAEQQAEERVHRIGQEHQVNIYRYHVNNSVESWISGLKQKKLVIAGDLNLVSGETVPVDFNFDDIAELFKTHVAFTDDKEGKEGKEDKERRPAKAKTPPTPAKRKAKKAVKKRGPPIKKWKA